MLVMALVLAFILNNKHLKFRGFFRTAIFLPCATSLVAYAIIFRSLFATDGFINNLLLKTGIISEAYNFLANPTSAKIVIIIALVWRWTGYNMVFYLAGLQNIEYSVYEAAKIDGASPLQTFFRITVPLLKPTILMTAIMSTNGTLQLFDESMNLTNGEPGNASITMSGNGRISKMTRQSIRGYQVNMIKVSGTDISALVHAVEAHVMDGVILTRISGNNAADYLKKRGVPFAALESCEDSSVLQADMDYENACNEITNALIRKGFHKLSVMCSSRDHSINERKLKGILNAHVQNYMVLDRSFIFYDTEYENVAEMVVEKVMNERVDCILCMDDHICMVILKVIHKLRLEIPKDIRIACLYGSILLEECHPSISFINFNVERLGKEASRMLYVFLTEHKLLPRTVLGYELKMKDSTN